MYAITSSRCSIGTLMSKSTTQNGDLLMSNAIPVIDGFVTYIPALFLMYQLLIGSCNGSL